LQRDRGTGVLFITHDFGVVAEIADRVAVLKHGELVEMGPTQELLVHPRHAYTRMLIDSVPGHDPPPRAAVAGIEDTVVLKTEHLAKVYATRGLFGSGRSGIVGESGSGKSTVARCIARLIDPTEGSVSIGGVDIARTPSRHLREIRRKVQVVFQDPYRSLNPRRTVGESIIEGPMNYGMSRDDALGRARRLMELVRLDPAALDRYPHQFSGGQRQRICIARALAMEPELLIADEAVSALDVSVQAQVLQLLEEIRHRLHLAVLFITHDLRVAAQICDKVAVMSKGRVVEYGPAERVFRSPEHAYTKALFEAAPGRHFKFGTSA
jgi:peptide/nickel transport system ATP-binding protein